MAAQRGVRVLLTTDHGSLHLRVENPSAVFATGDADELRLPPGGMKRNYVLCRDDYFFVYPTKLREYQQRYRDSFLHGGVSPEEMVLPAVLLTPR